MEHFIKNIEITNFKSIRQAEVKDCRRVNVFVGYPNVGKSNVLEALSLFSVSKKTNEVKLKHLIRVTEEPTIYFNGNIQKPFKIIANKEFELTGYHLHGDLKLTLSNLNLLVEVNEPTEEPLKVPFQYNTITFRNFEYQSVVENDQFALLEEALLYPKMYKFKKHTNTKLGDYSVLSYPFGENMFSVIQSNSSIRRELSALLKPYSLKMLFDSGYQSFSLLKTIDEENVFSVDYSLIADTLQRLFFYKTAVLSNKEQILLLEEPEAHMFPPYISQLTSDIIQDKNQNQFFIATHSPFVLNDFMEDLKDDELSIYAVGLEYGETTIRRLTDKDVTEIYQYGIDLFFNLENYLKPEELVKQ